MISRLNLYDLNGNKINIEAIGLYGIKLNIPSPSYSRDTQKIDGGGMIVVDTVLNSRSLSAEFKTVANSYGDLLKQKTELFNLLGNGNEFYIEQIQQKGIVWKCYLDDWNPDVINTRVTTFSIPLTCLSGTSETLYLTNKKFTTSNFIFKNVGLTIDPRIHAETTITFKGASNNLSIINKTTGDLWSYTGTTIDGDKIVLKGINSTLNGNSIVRNTNKKILTFTKGNNEIEISGATGSFELEISTRFYFL